MSQIHDPSASQVLESLSEPWAQALGEAWLSWQHGNFGIGAVLYDPIANAVVARGRNATTNDPSGELALHSNWMAHAEMNLFASMAAFDAEGLHLYTTLEPCLMCAATCIFLNVDRVTFGASDEYFDGLGSLWEQHPYTAARHPPSTQALFGKLSSFCRLLPLSFTFEWRQGSSMAEQATRHRPDLAPLAKSGIVLKLRDLSLAEALAVLWPDLPGDEVRASE